MRKFTVIFSTLCLSLVLTIPASAAGPLEYIINAPGPPEYGKPSSFEVVHNADNGAMKNEDVSKNAALIPPGFGSYSADTLNTGTPLTPNLAPGYQPVSGTVINGGSGVIQPPAMGSGSSSGSIFVPGSSTVTVTGPGGVSSGYTKVTDDLYYTGGHLGT